MTDLRKAANMALQALEFSLPAIEDFGSKEQLTDCHRAIMALYKSLAQPEQEPVAKHVCNLWINPETSFYEVDRCTHPINEVIPVYTAPPKREWVGLTDDEVAQIEKTVLTRKQAIKMIEHHLKEKNT